MFGSHFQIFTSSLGTNSLGVPQMLRESKSNERRTDTLVVLVFLWDLLFGFVEENIKRPALFKY